MIRVGKILEVAPHPQADKLYITKVDLGGEVRQIVAGMKQHYKPEEMVGKLVATIVNLEPARLRGVESAGMMFAFDEDNGKRIALVVPDGAASPGQRILALGRPPGQPAGKISFKDFGRIYMSGARIDGRYRAVLLAQPPGHLVTESGTPMTSDREMPDGARVR
jgi:methionine--tRNA ligase beta chain